MRQSQIWINLQLNLALQTNCYYRHQSCLLWTRASPWGNAWRNDWNKLPLLQTLVITEMQTLSSPPVWHFTCFFSCYSRHWNTSSKILTLEHYYDKGKWRTNSSIRSEHENFLLAARSFCSSWGQVRNFMFVWLHIISYV